MPPRSEIRLRWMRDQCAERKLTNVTADHLRTFLEHYDGDAQKAMDALDAVWHGKTFRDPDV